MAQGTKEFQDVFMENGGTWIGFGGWNWMMAIWHAKTAEVQNKKCLISWGDPKKDID